MKILRWLLIIQQHTCTYVSAMFGFGRPVESTDNIFVPMDSRGFCHGLELLY